MMTKTQMCRMIIDREKEDVNQSDESMVSKIYSSTSLGIALETIGVITTENNPEAFRYLSERGGVLFSHFDRSNGQIYQMSFRELLSLLPDELPKKGENNE